MADHPFANAGLGMFGADSALARQSATPDGASDKMKKVIGLMTGGALESLGIKEFLDKLGGGSESQSGIAAPLPVAPNYSVAPPSPVSPEGINPMRMPNAVQGGIGLNAQPAGAVNPFQFQTTPLPKLMPDDEHRNQVKSAWS
jgi:hypothetical protein